MVRGEWSNFMKKYKVIYDNDTSSDDESYYQWWLVTNDDKLFECSDEDDANWLCKLLNSQIIS